MPGAGCGVPVHRYDYLRNKNQATDIINSNLEAIVENDDRVSLISRPAIDEDPNMISRRDKLHFSQMGTDQLLFDLQNEKHTC